MYNIIAIKGNIHKDRKIEQEYTFAIKSGSVEYLELPRLEMQKRRLRKKTNKGTDLGIILKKKLEDGDVLDSDKFIVVKQAKELVACVSINGKSHELKEPFKVLVSIGHIIGNRHKPVSIENQKIYFPVHNEAEIQTYRILLGKLSKHIKVGEQEQVFQPQDEMSVHEH